MKTSQPSTPQTFQILKPAPRLSRRSFLRGAGAVVALPWLEAMMPRTTFGAAVNPGLNAAGIPKRAVFCMWGLGVNGRDFTPATTGRDYAITPILKPMEAFRDDMTIVSGMKLTHSGGHRGDRTFLTGTNAHEGGDLRVSCDQELAEVIGQGTRYQSLPLGIKRGTGFGGSPQDHTLSWSRSGMPIPAENRPHILFEKLFGTETPETIAEKEENFVRRTSLLDSVMGDAKRYQKYLGKTDQEKMDEYLSGIRDLEASIQKDKEWLYKPKPEVETPSFGADQGLDPEKSGLDYRRYQRLMFDVITLALQTDSTRVISYMPRMDLSDGTGSWKSEGNPYGYHEMTHHGEDREKLKWLTKSDIWYSEEWAYFLNKLKSVKEGEGTLLDNTVAIWGSTGGTKNAHNNYHLPAIVCGGAGHGLKHQGHIQQEGAYYGNLWQTMFTLYGVPVPEDFQGGEADGMIRDLV